jgi:hypothetical protein
MTNGVFSMGRVDEAKKPESAIDFGQTARVAFNTYARVIDSGKKKLRPGALYAKESMSVERETESEVRVSSAA